MNKIRFLIWNTGNKTSTTEQILKSIIIEYGIFDFILLNECKHHLSDAFCTENDMVEFKILKGEGERLKQRIYLKKNSIIKVNHLNNIVDDEEEERIVGTTISGVLIERTISHLARAVLLELEIDSNKYLLSCVHLPSKKNLDETGQLQASQNYKRYITERASEYNYNIIIAGDFNMNPFDSGMVEPMGFYALNHADFVKNKKIFQHSPEMMFYNPCWWLLGDYHALKDNKKVSGTHYYESAPSKKLNWHLLDQVIISESMISRFEQSELEIIEPKEIINELIKEKTLRKNAVHSGHLPLKFTINL